MGIGVALPYSWSVKVFTNDEFSTIVAGARLWKNRSSAPGLPWGPTPWQGEWRSRQPAVTNSAPSHRMTTGRASRSGLRLVPKTNPQMSSGCQSRLYYKAFAETKSCLLPDPRKEQRL